MQDAADGRFDVVVVYDQDRLSREMLDSEYLIERVFRPNGIRFRTVIATIENEGPESDAFRQTRQIWAQYERRKIGQRVKAGIARSMEAGIEITKSGLVRKAINKFRGMEVGDILGTH